MTDEMNANYKTLLDALTNEMQALHKELQECKEKLSQELCGDAISRQAVIDTIDKWVKSMHVLITLPANEVTPLFESVHELPSVTAQPKMGYWEWVQYDSNPNIGNWHCSECRTIIPDMPEETYNTPIYKWCPMCGCKMQEVEE